MSNYLAQNFPLAVQNRGQSRRPSGLRHFPAASGLLGLRYRIPPGVWMSASYVFSGRSFCDGLINRPDESCRVWCVWMLS